jgi:hypothetical protein
MGCGKSKEDESDDGEEELVYDTAQMTWDEHGNLRYGECRMIEEEAISVFALVLKMYFTHPHIPCP